MRPGTYFMQGNEACALGAVAAGCRFFAFYPITPAGEIAEKMSELLPKARGVYIQMEDEIAAIGSVIGASWTGRKAMTATSGPGFSLMQENIGYAVMTETPCVIVDIQRAGPSTGIVSAPMQGDVVQARHGSHGEYEIIALAPSSAQEMFDMTIRAFNLAEQYRTPVIVLADETVAHMREEVLIPEAGSFKIVNRKFPSSAEEASHAFLNASVAPMPVFGNGFSAHVTGSSHDEFGKRQASAPEAIDKIVRTIVAKIKPHAAQMSEIEKVMLDDADTVLVAYGSCARTAEYVMKQARNKGVRVGLLRLKGIWPFPGEAVEEALGSVRRVIVLENNLGQVFPEIERLTTGETKAVFLPPETLATMHRPDYVLQHVMEAT
jgi:2-oxoglutarate ferredoxin oxidoreductase subunit alpha